MSRMVLTYPDMPPVLTQSAGDARYLQQSQADARYLQLTGGTLSGGLTVNGAVSIRHATSGFVFYARDDFTKQWQWYGDTGGARLYQAFGTFNGDRWRMAPDGTMVHGQAIYNDAFSNQYWIANNTAGGIVCLSADSEIVLATGATGIGSSSRSLASNRSQTIIHNNNNSNLWLHAGNSTNMRIATGAGNLELSGAAGVIHPSYDNTMALGAGNVRWTQVSAVAGTINTCSREVKEIVGTVSDSEALAQLMGLPAIYRFHYKHYVPIEGAAPDASLEDGFRWETDTTQEFIGPIAEEMPMDMKVGDAVTVGNVNTEGHLMASLRGSVKEHRAQIAALMKRIEALEAAEAARV